MESTTPGGIAMASANDCEEGVDASMLMHQQKPLAIRTKMCHRWTPLVFHVVVVLLIVFAISYDAIFVRADHIFEESNEASGLPYSNYGGTAKFLTTWDIYVQLVFVLISILCDVIADPNNNNNNSGSKFKHRVALIQLRDFVFAAIAAPIALYTVSIFWGVWAIDRELIWPVAVDEVYPWWLNHLKHTLPLVFIAIETATIRHVYPSCKNVFCGNLCLSSAYLFWICHIAYVSGCWIYPVVHRFDYIYRPFLIGIAFSYSFLCTFVEMRLNSFIWGDPKTKKTPKVTLYTSQNGKVPSDTR